MNLTSEDEQLLAELCGEHEVNFDKVVKPLQIVCEHQFIDRRTGIYDALREVVRAEFSN